MAKNCTHCGQGYNDPHDENDYCSPKCFKNDAGDRKRREDEARKKCRTPWKRMYTKRHADKRTDPRNSVSVYFCRCGFYHLTTKKGYKEIAKRASESLSFADIGSIQKPQTLKGTK